MSNLIVAGYSCVVDFRFFCDMISGVCFGQCESFCLQIECSMV